MGLPDCNDAGSTLIAVQVTLQTNNRKEKIRKSIVGRDTWIANKKNVTFVLINLSWRSLILIMLMQQVLDNHDLALSGIDNQMISPNLRLGMMY